MRSRPLIVLLALLLIGCRPTAETAAASRLVGTWSSKTANPDGSEFRITMTVSSEGHFVQHINGNSPDKQVVASDLEGTLQVKDGFLIVITTRHSSPNAPVPMTNRARIVTISDKEFSIIPESETGVAGSSSDPKVFRRIR